MNYQRIYDEIIERAKHRGLNKKLLEYYTEKHHIIPRCMNGTNDKSNLVLLTGREHYICHHLLWKSYKNNYKLFYAYKAISQLGFSKSHYAPKFTSKQFEVLRTIQGHNTKIRMQTYKASNETKERMRQALVGRVLTDEWKEKIANSNIGKTASFETKQKQSASAKKRFESKEQKLLCGNGSRGRSWSEEHKQHLRIKSTGFKHSDETKKKLSEAKIGKGCKWRFKSCIIDDIKFETIKDAAVYCKTHYNIGHRKMLTRLKSENFPNWSF